MEYTFEAVSLMPFNSLSSDEKGLFIEQLQDNYDVPLGDCDTVLELIEYFETKYGFWVIVVDGCYAGVFSVGSTARLDTHVQLSTIIFHQYRGTGVNTVLKKAASQAFVDSNIKLCINVRDWNERSIRAIEKNFPTATRQTFEVVGTRGNMNGVSYRHHFYDLSGISAEAIPAESQEVYTVVRNLVIGLWGAPAAEELVS